MDAKAENSAARAKKLGLVTMLGGVNYGGAFQSFSLFRVLESHGYDVSIIVAFPNPNAGKLKGEGKAKEDTRLSQGKL